MPASTSLDPMNRTSITINHIPTQALVDSGAIRNYISLACVHQFTNELENLPSPMTIILGDSSSTTQSTQSTPPLLIQVGAISTWERFLVVPLLTFPVILGNEWLRNANPIIDWRNGSISLNSSLSPPTKSPNCQLAPSIAVANLKEPLVSMLPNFNTSTNEFNIPDFLFSRYQRLFSETEALILPEHRKFDMHIDLIDDASLPPHGRIYTLTTDEDTAFFTWLQDMLKKGYVRRSLSPYGAPCFFTTKKDKTLRPCMDYRKLNALTKSGKYPLPLIADIIAQVSQGSIFSKIDLRNAYNLVRIAPGHEFKTAFITKWGKFEFLVMPFGLSGAPAIFQAMMNELFYECFDFCLPYLDDLIIFSKTIEEHENHLSQVCSILSANNLFAKPSKCLFFQKKIAILGYVIDTSGTHMESDKIESIATWPVPRNVKELRSFLGFINFYRDFIPSYAKILQPLFSLLKSDATFTWTDVESSAFVSIKAAFAKSSMLVHPDNSKPFILETDASDFAIAAILSQATASGLSPVAFVSRQMTPCERNYDIYDKELLAIVEAFKKWRHILLSSNVNTTVLADHLNLKYFMTTKNLTRRQARWYNFLSDFLFTVEHQPGSANRADLLSRREDFKFDSTTENQIQIFTPSTEDASTLSLNLLLHSECLDIDFETKDDWPILIADFLDSGSWDPNISSRLRDKLIRDHVPWFTFKDDRFCRLLPDAVSTRLYVPFFQRNKLITSFHENLAHLKTDSIFDILAARYWWPLMKASINRVVTHCAVCQLSAPAGDARIHAPRNLQSLPNVGLPFQRWGLDAVGPLPITLNGHRYLLTAIEYCTRWPIAVPVNDLSATTVGKFIYEHIIGPFGSPHELITDRGKYFLQAGLQEFFKKRQIDHRPTTPYHPQTNGMVERMHAPLKHGLRTLSIEHPDDWDSHLTQVLIALRARTHSVTGFSPFKLLYGIEPRLESDVDLPSSTIRPLSELEQLEELGDIDARSLEELGQFRAAANARSITAAKIFKLRKSNPQNHTNHHFAVGDLVKLKKHNPTTMQFNWKGPYFIVGLSYPGTYYLMTPQGLRLDSTINQNELAPWLNPPVVNHDFFYDTTARRTTNLSGPSTESIPIAPRPWAPSLTGGTVIPSSPDPIL